MDEIEIKAGNFTLEKMYEIWNENDGDHMEVGLDRDGLDLIEIRYKNIKGEVFDRLSMQKDQAILLIKALQNLVGEH